MKHSLLFTLGSLGLVALVAACSSNGADGAAGDPGAPGAPGESGTTASQPQAPTINQVAPRFGVLGRDLEVRITFDGKMPDAPSVDFGDGVKVGKVTQDGPDLVCEISIPEELEIGARDVTVTGGAAPIVAKQGFVVAAGMDLTVSGGRPEQGGLVRVDLSNNDKVWFDTENFLLLPIASQSDGTLVQLAATGFTGTDGSVVLLGDPLAKTGPLGFVGLNDPSDPSTPAFVSKPDAVTVAARAPEAVTSGTPVEKTLSKELETAFFSADLAPQTGEGLLVDALATAPADSTMQPVIFGYPASGKIADLLDQQMDDPGFPDFGIPATQARIAYPVAAATKGFFVVVDGGLANSATTKLAFDFETYRAQIFKEKSDAHDVTPQNLGSLPGTAATVPGRVVTGELTKAGEVDLYTFTGLSASKVTDMQISATGDADVTVLVDTIATFDSDDLVTVSLGGRAGSATTNGFVGATRFIKVVAADGADKDTGKYTLGFRRIGVAIQ